jgi:hypothetical protein
MEKSNVSNSNSCSAIFDKLWYCGTPVNQLDKIYKTGDIDDCSIHFNKFYRCLKNKIIKNDSKSRDVN